MEQQFGELWPFVVLATFLGAFIAPIIGYFKRPKNGGAVSSTMHGAMMIDSSVARDISVALERIAFCAEKIEHQLRENADAEAENRKIVAAVEAARIKWEQEHKG